MRRRLIVLCLPATLALAGSADAAPGQFDLVCKGEAQIDDQRTGKETKSFTDRLSVDLDQQLFCLDGCWHLTEAGETHIAYHYTPEVADRDHPRNTYRQVSGSTAGPFEQQEDLTVDLLTGMFERFYVYDFGDRVSFRHKARYKGRCTFAPFTPPKRNKN
jgi:hypothetical protein